jgi:hypothetical protein
VFENAGFCQNHDKVLEHRIYNTIFVKLRKYATAIYKIFKVFYKKMTSKTQVFLRVKWIKNKREGIIDNKKSESKTPQELIQTWKK